MVKYGPYQLTPDRDNEISVLQWTRNATKPCSDCVLKYAAVDLVHQDGTAAAATDDIKLESLVLSIEGDGHKDLSCDSSVKGERILVADGNRKETIYGLSGSDEYGIYLSTEDKLSIHAEMSNSAGAARNVLLQLTFEYVQGKPANHKTVKAAWFDAEPCGAQPFVSPYSGKWVAMTVDETGPDLTLLQNGRRMCETRLADANLAKKYPELDPTAKFMQCMVGDVKEGDRILLKTGGSAGAKAFASPMGLLVVDKA